MYCILSFFSSATCCFVFNFFCNFLKAISSENVLSELICTAFSFPLLINLRFLSFKSLCFALKIVEINYNWSASTLDNFSNSVQWVEFRFYYFVYSQNFLNSFKIYFQILSGLLGLSDSSVLKYVYICTCLLGTNFKIKEKYWFSL